jgi:hypothetical protein
VKHTWGKNHILNGALKMEEMVDEGRNSEARRVKRRNDKSICSLYVG